MMKRIAALIGLALVLLVGNAVPAQAADSHLILHKCQVIATVGSYQAVHCANLWQFDSDVSWGENEIFCQTTSGTPVRCLGVKEIPGVCHTVNGCKYGVQGTCGTALGHSACPVPRVVNDSPFAGGGCGNVRGRSIDTVVVLPNGTRVGGVGTSIETAWSRQAC
ncbi:hypothetical protein M1L60_24625 [Actinoplanes sp. TRM 88003]|uniref:Uncharacterized protein n=1 Tax=Paractinoplanes aksuensis TaxID=2939490 RepID=A0ABT1DSI0_9ACTN|nr:hypothetical protein [Actinoplanes aksuensis]MCO8273787.1 hypothetical protein [Actinoplanes aksuensis]